MADVISAVASTAITNLGSEALHLVASARHFKSDLDKLSDTITRVKRILLAHANGQQHDFEGLTERLEDTVYDADDLLDELTTLAERKWLMVSSSHGGFTQKVRIFFSRVYQIPKAFHISKEIKRIRKTLDHIVGDCQRFPLPRREPAQPQRETFSSVEVDDVIGRYEEKQKVLDILFAQYEEKNVVYLPIVGTGGVGKTRLAQLAFNDEDVKSHFEPRKWVCVGDKFNVIDIIGRLVGSKTDDSSLEETHNEFRTKMGGKKYLFVLDDIWEESLHELSRLRSLLSVGAKGSRVIVTTRSLDTAHGIGTISPLELQVLSDDDSWKLFTKVAFGAEGHSQEQKDPSLVQTGKEIVKKCKNLPLVIKVIASLLRGKDETYWRNFRDNDLASIPDATDNILPLLELSYFRLSPQLKQCFLYCSLFPKDSLIDRVKICHLWMAQGFITSSSQDSKVSLEDDADQCFNKLLNRCFFQEIYWNDCGEIRTFKMHDCLHELARKIAGQAILRVDGKLNSVLPAATRHFSVGKLSLTSNLPSYLQKEGSRLRTFYQPDFYIGETVLSRKVSDLVSSFRSIRMLDLNGLKIKQLPDSIGRLIHLRYLDLSHNDFKMLPRSFTRLHNLETLNLSWCSNLKELPWDLCKLVNLQSLDLNFCVELAYMPPGMGNMSRLQRLTIFVVGFRESNRTSCCSKPQTIDDASGFDDLFLLENLRGRLSIEIKRNGNNNRVPIIRTKADCLLNKSNLTELNIDMGDATSSSGDGSRDEEELLECLQPHSNIRSLSLRSYRGRKFPSWMTMNDLCLRLPNLVRIGLSHCNDLMELPEGISQLSSSLRYLEIIGCRGLKALPQGIGDLTSLKYLSLYRCKGLAERCQKPNGEDWLKIMHVPEVVLPGGEVVLHRG